MSSALTYQQAGGDITRRWIEVSGSKEGIHGLPSNVHTAAHRIDGNLVEGQTAEERQHVRRDPCT